MDGVQAVNNNAVASDRRRYTWQDLYRDITKEHAKNPGCDCGVVTEGESKP